MSEVNAIRTSLEVGFAQGELPPEFLRFRGRVTRSIAGCAEFPYEDSQFEVVFLDGAAVSRATVKESHRVLRPDGRLFFIVKEKTSRQEGYTMPEVYTLVRDGFNIIAVDRPPWWRFGWGGHTLTICASKKNWRTYKGLASGVALPFAPFHNHTRT